MKSLITAAVMTFAVLTAQSAVAQDITGDRQICLSTPDGLSMCQFASMAQCENAKLPATISRCVDRSQVESTVGQGSSSNRPSLRSGPPISGAVPPRGDSGQR
jgi:hypothetical protein